LLTGSGEVRRFEPEVDISLAGSEVRLGPTPGARQIFTALVKCAMDMSLTPTITVFDRSPDGGLGFARDTRVRWALEEVGRPYDVRGVSLKEMKQRPYLTQHPFGSIPAYEEGDLVLFESGAIIFHIAEHHEGLLPANVNARARAITWMFAAISTIEPAIIERENTRFQESERAWYAQRMPAVEDRIRVRLRDLSNRIGDAEWLDGDFSAGDLVMVSVLLRLKPTSLLAEFSNLTAYVARGEARQAYKRAFEAQFAFNNRPEP
jgi:glutathione S-transferase